MHGIHHSIVKDETNSNWSSGLTIWDRLHGTLRLNVPQNEIQIGFPRTASHGSESPGLLNMPFVEQRQTWLLPNDARPQRLSSHVEPNHLLP